MNDPRFKLEGPDFGGTFTIAEAVYRFVPGTSKLRLESYEPTLYGLEESELKELADLIQSVLNPPVPEQSPGQMTLPLYDEPGAPF